MRNRTGSYLVQVSSNKMHDRRAKLVVWRTLVVCHGPNTFFYVNIMKCLPWFIGNAHRFYGWTDISISWVQISGSGGIMCSLVFISFEINVSDSRTGLMVLCISESCCAEWPWVHCRPLSHSPVVKAMEYTVTTHHGILTLIKVAH